MYLWNIRTFCHAPIFVHYFGALTNISVVYWVLWIFLFFFFVIVRLLSTLLLQNVGHFFFLIEHYTNEYSSNISYFMKIIFVKTTDLFVVLSSACLFQSLEVRKLSTPGMFQDDSRQVGVG